MPAIDGNNNRLQLLASFELCHQVPAKGCYNQATVQMRKQYDADPGKTFLAAGATPNASKGGHVLITCRPGVSLRHYPQPAGLNAIHLVIQQGFLLSSIHMMKTKSD